jgi:hypothetical protein
VEVRDVEFTFDGVISERPAGVPSLAALVLISPGSGEPRVVWGRRTLLVRPRQGWRDNTTYVIQLLPGVMDLQNNIRREGASLVFSTGPSLDSASISGVVFDWVAGVPLRSAVVQATPVQPADSAIPPPRDTLRYSTTTDSVGNFTLSHLRNGPFIVRAFQDANSNRSLDARAEQYDTAMVELLGSGQVELLAFRHDSIGPIMAAATVRDSFTVVVRFQTPVDPTQTVDATVLGISVAEDSTPVAIALIRPERPFDRLLGPRDSARADSVARADSARLAALPDSARLQQAIAPSRPAPPVAFIIQVANPLRPGTRYFVFARQLRGLLGIARPGEDRFPFETPAARVDTLPPTRRR